jgi:hypothetical protein
VVSNSQRDYEFVENKITGAPTGKFATRSTPSLAIAALGRIGKKKYNNKYKDE